MCFPEKRKGTVIRYINKHYKRNIRIRTSDALNTKQQSLIIQLSVLVVCDAMMTAAGDTYASYATEYLQLIFYSRRKAVMLM